MPQDKFGEAEPMGKSSAEFDPWTAPGSLDAVPPPPMPPALAPPPMPSAPTAFPSGSVPAPPTFQYGTVPPPPPPLNASSERNWMGIVSLVLGLLGGGLLGFVFGVMGLNAAKEGRATNRTIAIWGIVLNCTMWIVYLAAFGVLTALGSLAAYQGDGIGTGDESIFDAPDALPEGHISILDAAPGTCFDAADEAKFAIGTIEVVPCDLAHYGQVYAVADLAAQAYVSEDHMAGVVDVECFSDSAIAAIQPEVVDDLFAEYYFPTAESWNSGDRRYVCFAYADPGPLTSTILVNGDLSQGSA